MNTFIHAYKPALAQKYRHLYKNGTAKIFKQREI